MRDGDLKTLVFSNIYVINPVKNCLHIFFPCYTLKPLLEMLICIFFPCGLFLITKFWCNYTCTTCTFSLFFHETLHYLSKRDVNVMYLISILTRKIDLREFFSILVKMSEKIGMQTKKFFVGFITWIYYRKQEISL